MRGRDDRAEPRRRGEMRGDNLTLRHKDTKSYDPCLECDRRLQQRPVHNLSKAGASGAPFRGRNAET